MPRLPIPGSDASEWGDLLNNFLRVAHNEDGSLKLSEIVAQKYGKPLAGIPKTDLTYEVQATLSAADAAMSTLQEAIDTASADLQVTTDAALAQKEPTIAPGTGAHYYRGDKTWQPLNAAAVGLGAVVNQASLPLAGGTLTGGLTVNGGNVIRAYHTDNAKYIEIKTDQFWSRINAGGTSGFVLTGTTVQMDATGSIVTYTPTIRPNSNLNTNIGSTAYYYNNLYAQRHYVNATAYLDGATAGNLLINSQKLGFFGVAPALQQTGGALTAGASYTANEQLMLSRMWTALRTLGLLD